MKVIFPLAAFALCLAACHARPLTANDAGGAGNITVGDARGGDATNDGQTCGHKYPSANNTGVGTCGDFCCFDCAP